MIQRRFVLELPMCALLVACGATAARPIPAGPTPVVPVARAPVERAWPVMGTMLRATVWDLEPERAAAVLREVRAAVTRVDSLMSNYRADSDVSRVNRGAGSGDWIPVSGETLEVLNAALEAARSSGGAFDPTVGPLVDVWGFYRERAGMPGQAALDSVRTLVGWRRVEIDAGRGRVRLPRAGMRLDFGAIAKGYAVDLALAAARAAGAERALVDLGGNIGVLGDAPGGGAWPLGLSHPRDPEAPFAVLNLEQGAIATSGDYERFFMHDGVRYAHILDPRTGWPVQGIASVSVLAPTGIASDAWSTTLFVLGPERGCEAIAGMRGVAAMWVLAPAGGEGASLHAVIGGDPGVRVELAPDAVRSDCGDR